MTTDYADALKNDVLAETAVVQNINQIRLRGLEPMEKLEEAQHQCKFYVFTRRTAQVNHSTASGLSVTADPFRARGMRRMTLAWSGIWAASNYSQCASL